jgi:hypothetical protein
VAFQPVQPEKRSQWPALINMHPVKNRWLIRRKNLAADLYARRFGAAACLANRPGGLPAFDIAQKLNTPRLGSHN